MQTQHVGVIGVGWGAIVQAPAFQAVEGFVLSALCSRRPESVAAAGRQVGVDDVSTDWRAFVERDDLDVISIATPSPTHREMVLAALAAAKHVLCEKPLASNAADAEKMVLAARDTGTATAVSFETRWLPERTAFKRAVEDGIVGRPYSVRLHQSAAYWHPSRPLQPLWMYDQQLGGGYVAGMLAHDIDFVCTLFGEPLAVCADVRTSVTERSLPDGGKLPVTADDTCAVLIRLDSRALAVLTVSVMGRHMPASLHLDVFGADGTLVLDKQAGNEPVLRGTGEGADGLADHAIPRLSVARLSEAQQRRASGLVAAMASMLSEWRGAFDGKPTTVPTFADGLRVQRVIDAARLSSAGAGWVGVEHTARAA